MVAAGPGQRLGWAQAGAVAVDQRREQLLVLAREAGHVGVGDDVGAVLVVALVRDREADLVQTRGPGEEGGRALALQLPFLAALPEEIERGALHAAGLHAVDGVALAHAADRELAQVLVADAADEVPEHALAQRRERAASVRFEPSKSAIRIARPPGRTSRRSSARPLKSSLSQRPASSSSFLSFFRPFSVMPSPFQPFSCRICSIERIVPDEPTHSLQPSAR